MGWTGVYEKPEKNKKGLSEFFSSKYTGENEKNIFTFMDLSVKGNAVYILYSIFNKVKSEKRITCDVVLISYDVNMFSFKEMNENVGPFGYDVPVKFLKQLTPTDSKYANSWREKCYEMKKKEKLTKKGTTIIFDEPVSFPGEMIQTFIVHDEKKSLFKKPGCSDLYRIRGYKNMSYTIVEGV